MVVLIIDKLDEAKKMLRDCISALESSISKEEGLVKVSVISNVWM